jgi:hypothetical protein
MASVAGVENGGSKPATAARIYDYFLGGTHNFPADREAAQAIAKMFPPISDLARANRAFLRRAVRFAAEAGVRQFLDIGSGIPTVGNVHDVAQSVIPDARVVYVDMDPVAVSESLDILENNPWATAIKGDLREPQHILTHPQVGRLIDFNEPVALLLLAVLHFVPEDDVAVGAVDRLVAALAPGSYLVVSHASADGGVDPGNVDTAQDLYKRQTATPFHLRSHDQVTAFFTRFELVEPGVVWLPQWRADLTSTGAGEGELAQPDPFADDPAQSAGLAAVGRLP